MVISFVILLIHKNTLAYAGVFFCIQISHFSQNKRKKEKFVMKKKVNKGYEVVYGHGGCTLSAGSRVVYPCYRLAAQYRTR